MSTAANTAPALAPRASLQVPPGGVLVGSLVSGAVTDADGNACGIAITRLDTSLGTWQYSIDNGATWLTARADLLNSLTNELALLLGPGAGIRLLPFGESAGAVADAITFRAWDQSSGAPGQYVAITNGGGTSAFSAASATGSAAVAAVNAAPTFSRPDHTGRVVTDIQPSQIDYATSLVVQPDGRILVGGGSSSGTPLVARYTADGQLDTSFGTGGLAKVPTMQFTYSAALQADGKILLAVKGAAGLAVARFNANGSIDTSFGSAGIGRSVLSPDGEETYAVAVEPDGQIVVAGSHNHTFTAVRYNPNGTLDPAFGSAGKSEATTGAVFAQAYVAAVQADGKLVLGGISALITDLANTQFTLLRLDANGAPDPTFGSAGVVRAPTTGLFQGLSDLAVQPDGKVLVTGRADNTIELRRYNADGTVDTTFGRGTGLVNSDFGDFNRPRSLVVQPDGRILVTGEADSNVLLARYLADGSVDTGFGGGTGRVLTYAGPGASSGGGYSVRLQPDGKILVAGSTNGDSFADFLLLRYNADGSPDTTFGADSGNRAPSVGQPVAYTENAPAIRLDASVVVYDAELAAANGGIGNYAGASVTLLRHGGANADDVFSAQGNLAFQGGSAVLSGTTIGTLATGAGRITLAFNANATQVRVNEALSSIGYLNLSDRPDTSLQVDWILEDGNGGQQGAGGSLATTASTPVTITRVNDLPTGTVAISGTARQGETLTATVALSDRDGMGPLQYQWFAGADAIGGATGTTLMLAQQQVGKAITLRVSYVDGGGSLESVVGASTATVQNVNDAPTGVVTISGHAVQGMVLTASNTLADADGMTPVTYEWKAGTVKVGTGSSYVVGAADVGKAITVTASYVDGYGHAEAVVSAPAAPASEVPLAALRGMAYHWKSHVLLSGVQVHALDVASTAAGNGTFDVRGAQYDAATGAITLQLWAYAAAPAGSIDFLASPRLGGAVGYTSALDPSAWTALSNTIADGTVLAGAYSNAPGSDGASGPLRLGTLRLTMGDGNTAVAAKLDNLRLGDGRMAPFYVAGAADETAADGRFDLGQLPTGSYALAATRAASDSGFAISAADALAALRLAVRLNPNRDPDGSGPQQALKVSPYQLIAADVDKDGIVSSADALAILRMAVRSPDAPAQEWLLVDERQDLWDEARAASSLTAGAAGWQAAMQADVQQDGTRNLVGVLKGDVDGSWGSEGDVPRVEGANAGYFTQLAQQLGVPTDIWGF